MKEHPGLNTRHHHHPLCNLMIWIFVCRKTTVKTKVCDLMDVFTIIINTICSGNALEDYEETTNGEATDESKSCVLIKSVCFFTVLKPNLYACLF